MNPDNMGVIYEKGDLYFDTIERFINDYNGPDVDVYETLCDEIAIAYCKGKKLTHEGYVHFESIIDKPVKVMNNAFARVTNEREEDIELLNELFWGMAGYISTKKFNKYFCENPDLQE